MKGLVKKIPVFATSTSMLPKTLDRSLDGFNSSLLFADIAIDENQAGRGR
jgi:hypothetical protein